MKRKAGAPLGRDAGSVTLEMVAEAAGVSASTVSRILNGTAVVSQLKKQAVDEAIARLGFVPNPVARGLAGGRTLSIGVITQSIDSPFYGAALRGIEMELDAAGYSPLFMSGHWHAAEEARCRERFAVTGCVDDVHRRRLPDKAWGVFPHRVVDRQHPLVRNINTRFDVPHSRWNEITREQLDEAGLVTLVESAEVGPHLVVSPDGFRQVFFQGHPEYDIDSLLKEYKREVLRYCRGERPDYPPLVQHYFPEAAQTLLAALHDAPLVRRLTGLVPAGLSLEVAALLVLTLPEAVWSPLSSRAQAELRELISLVHQPDALRLEVEHLRRQLADLCALDRGAVCDRCAVAS